MKVKFKGVITELSAPDFPSNGIHIGIVVYDKMKGTDVDNLYKLMNENGIKMTMTSGKKSKKVVETNWEVLSATSYGALRTQILKNQTAGWESLGAPFWDNNHIFQAMIRRKN